MNLEAASKKATELTIEQGQGEVKYSRISVEPIARNGDSSQGYRVVGRDKQDFSKYHELAR